MKTICTTFSLFLAIALFQPSASASPIKNANRFQADTSIIVLPITLVNFTAKWVNNTIRLDWTYADESDQRRIVIQRSNDAVHFVNAGVMDITTIPSHLRSYTFTDSFPADGKNQYRLSFIYPDEQEQLSYIISLDGKARPFALESVYPNPFQEQLSVSWHAEQSGPAVVTLMDMSGKARLNVVQSAQKGYNVIRASELSAIPAGYYILQIKSAEGTLTRKLVKSR